MLPKGVQQWPLRGAGETLYWLQAPATLVSGDRLIGVDGRLAVCPESWLSGVALDRRGVAAELCELLKLPVERVLVSHGEPVLHDGRAALAHAVAEAEAPIAAAGPRQGGAAPAKPVASGGRGPRGAGAHLRREYRHVVARRTVYRLEQADQASTTSWATAGSRRETPRASPRR